MNPYQQQPPPPYQQQPPPPFTVVQVPNLDNPFHQNPQFAPPPNPAIYTAPPGSTVVIQGGYEAGARFGAGSQAGAIPPPPPGCMPNAAQQAAQAGHNVVITQRQQNVMEGTGGAGYTIW